MQNNQLPTRTHVDNNIVAPKYAQPFKVTKFLGTSVAPNGEYRGDKR